MEFDELKKDMAEFAHNINNIPLFDALKFSSNIGDLQACIHQSHGVGSERFKKKFQHVLEME